MSRGSGPDRHSLSGFLHAGPGGQHPIQPRPPLVLVHGLKSAPSLGEHTFSQVAPGYLRESRGSLEHLQDAAPIAGRQVFERLGTVFA